MSILFALVILAVVATFVSYPFWGAATASLPEDPLIAGLEAARDSKYREIRDAEADLASGKLSQSDFDQVNSELRRDAVKILKQLGKAGGGDDGSTAAPAGETTPESSDS